MPDVEQQAAVLEQSWRPEPVPRRRTPGDQGAVAARIDRIMALADAGLLFEGREACAELMFGFQPLLSTRPELLGRFGIALRRCRAEQLLRRIGMAVHGEAV